jgi:hypothetical protein
MKQNLVRQTDIKYESEQDVSYLPRYPTAWGGVQLIIPKWCESAYF